VGRAPVGAVVTAVRRDRARAVTVRVVAALVEGALGAGAGRVARVEETAAVAAARAVAAGTATRGRWAPASASSPS
jgi:hypothetical protein